MRTLAVLTSCLFLAGCSALRCGEHVVGDDSYREACGVLGSWGAAPVDATVGTTALLSFEPWGDYTVDGDNLFGAVRPAFVLLFDVGWLAEDTEVPAEAMRGGCIDMGVAHEADAVELTVLSEGKRHLDSETSWRVEWAITCDDWGFSSEGKDVLSFGRSAPPDGYVDAWGRPPEAE